MIKVIVAQRSGHSFEAAEEYGKVIPLMSDKISPFNVDAIQEKISQRLEELEITEQDYLLFCGQGIVNALVFYEWISKFGRVELLLFDARKETYVHRTVKE